MVFASIGILVYVFGIPLGMFYVLFRLRYANKLKHDDSLMVFGFLYTDFEPGFWFWNCVLCARRRWTSGLMVNRCLRRNRSSEALAWARLIRGI